jgi:hypothetical protein
MKYPTIAIAVIVLVGFSLTDLAPEPNIVKDAGEAGAQSWCTTYLAKLEEERLAKMKGNLESTTVLVRIKTRINV